MPDELTDTTLLDMRKQISRVSYAWPNKVGLRAVSKTEEQSLMHSVTNWMSYGNNHGNKCSVALLVHVLGPSVLHVGIKYISELTSRRRPSFRSSLRNDARFRPGPTTYPLILRSCWQYHRTAAVLLQLHVYQTHRTDS